MNTDEIFESIQFNIGILKECSKAWPIDEGIIMHDLARDFEYLVEKRRLEKINIEIPKKCSQLFSDDWKKK